MLRFAMIFLFAVIIKKLPKNRRYLVCLYYAELEKRIK